MACVAAMTFFVAACTNDDSPVPSTTAPPTPDRMVLVVTPVTSDTPEMLASFLLVKKGKTVECRNEPSIILPTNGKASGFAGTILVERLGTTTQVNWDAAGARSLIVNGHLWTPINTGGKPPLITILRDVDWDSGVTSLKACSAGGY